MSCEANVAGAAENRLPGGRLCFLDALRGVAAGSVLLAHLWGNSALAAPLVDATPAWLAAFFLNAGSGVEIFFVLSGFVIAYSLRTTAISRGAIGRFIVRRQLRLDPPYWVVLGLVLLVAAAERAIPGLVSGPLPDLKTIALNASYLHRFTEVSTLLGVAWTLCIEIQFYLAFIALLAVMHGVGWQRWLPHTLVATGVVSAWYITLGDPGAHFRFFLQPWCYFALGALGCWWLIGWTRWIAPATVGLAVAAAAAKAGSVELLTGLLTMIAIGTIALRGCLGSLSGGRVLQFLGGISYSLYLIHPLFIDLCGRLGQKLSGQGAASAIVWMLTAGLLSVASAVLLTRWVERPSIRLSRRFAAAPSRAEPAPLGVASGPGTARHEPAATKSTP